MELDKFIKVSIIILLINISCNNDRKDYYLNGKVKSIEQIKDGKLNGIKTVFRENGTIDWQAQYINNLLDGYYKKYFINGELKYLAYFRDNLQDSIELRYFENGKLSNEGTYNHGVEDGIFKEYYTDGSLKWISQFNNGKAKYIKQYKTNGNLNYWKSEIEIESLEGDTIREGRKYKARIYFHGPIDDDSLLFRSTLIGLKNAKIGQLHSNGTNAYLETGELPAGKYSVEVYVSINLSDSVYTTKKEIYVVSNRK